LEEEFLYYKAFEDNVEVNIDRSW